MEKLRKKRNGSYASGIPAGFGVYAYEFPKFPGWPDLDDMLSPAQQAELNRGIQNGAVAIWNATRNGVAHIFRGADPAKMATTAAVGYAQGGPAGMAKAIGMERAAACFNCHVATPVYDAIKSAVSPDSTSTRGK